MNVFDEGDGSAPRLIEGAPSLSAMLGATRYFEIDSRIARARYAVWLTTPPQYERAPARGFPVIYQPDGNIAAGAHGSLHALACADPINPIQPFIQVCVGYAGHDADRRSAVRIRDLVPPGEPAWSGFEAQLQLMIEGGLIEAEAAALMRHNMQHPAADRFLAFLIEELHPLVARDWRIDEAQTGLYGYSFGGLFAVYAAMKRPALFRRIGAGSPVIQPRRSSIFPLYDVELAAGADHCGRRLHVSVCEREITQPTPAQVSIGLGTVEFLTLAGKTPLKGLTLTTRIIDRESHISGIPAAWFSFLRDSYPAESP